MNYTVLAIPVFFLLIGIELLAARIGRRDYYRLSDTVNDLSCGILDQLLASWNPVWANLHYWVEQVEAAWRTRRWGDRIRLFLKPPGWRPAELGGLRPAPEVDRATYRKWDVEQPRGLAMYALAQFAPVLVGASLLLFQQQRLERWSLAVGSGLIAASLVTLGGLLERKAWAPGLEALRLLAASAYALGARPTVAVPAAVLAAASIVWLSRIGRDSAEALGLARPPRPGPANE